MHRFIFKSELKVYIVGMSTDFTLKGQLVRVPTS